MSGIVVLFLAVIFLLLYTLYTLVVDIQKLHTKIYNYNRYVIRLKTIAKMSGVDLDDVYNDVRENAE